MAHALRISYGIGDGNGATLRYAQQREPIDAGGFDHALEVARVCLERDVLHLPVGEAVAACVVADQPMPGGELAQQVAPDRAFPIVLEVIEPVGCLEQWRSRPDFGIGDADAVRRGAEMNFMPQGRRPWRLRFSRDSGRARLDRIPDLPDL